MSDITNGEQMGNNDDEFDDVSPEALDHLNEDIASLELQISAELARDAEIRSLNLHGRYLELNRKPEEKEHG